MFLLKAFSINRRLTFTLLVIGLAFFSVGSWWSVKSSIDADIQSRMNAEADRIESMFRDRMNTYANSLLHIRGHFIVDGVPSETKFRNFVSTLELPRRYPGIRGVGYIALVPAGKVDSFVADQKRQNPEFALKPSGPREIYSSVVMLEPTDWRNKKAIGYDMLTDSARREAILEAAKSGEPTMTLPVSLIQETDEDTQIGFLLYLPLYADRKGPTLEAGVKQHDPLNDVLGMVYSPFRAQDFFDGTFGAPSLKKEKVNFALEADGGPQGSGFIYNRFDLPEDQFASEAALTREFELFGRQLRFVIRPLPHFYTISDRYLPALVGFGAAFISVLILLVLKASQNQLMYETRARELSMQAAERSRAQTALLERLNEFGSVLSVSLDVETLLNRFFGFVGELVQVQVSSLYFTDSSQEKSELKLWESQGIAKENMRASISLPEVRAILANRTMIQKIDRDSREVLLQALGRMPEFQDWVMISLPSRELGRCGLLFLARTQGAPFDEIEIEVIESLVAQVGSSIENAKLFRKVEDASRQKNAFLANMSHEIRTPLNAMIGFSEMMARNDISESQRENLASNLRKSGTQLTRIIDDILDLSKVEAGKLMIDRKSVRLVSVVHEIKSVMDLRAREKGIEFKIESSGELPSHIETDEVRLKQILTNLIGNAIKFTDRGSILLHVRLLQNDSDENFLAFRIRDTGVGIPDEMQDQLFKPFSQADSSTTRKFGGSGLGLALSRRLCRELGGDLMLIESIEGQGSTFEARINAGTLNGVSWEEGLMPELPQYPVTERRLHNLPSLENVRILLVEDSPDNQEIFRFFLEGAGAWVEIVDNGLEAVRTAASDRFDIILMDIQIPEIDGREATRRIRHQGFEGPIVALTAHAMREERDACVKAGCNGHLTKPISGDALITEVAGYLRGTDGAIAAYSV